MSHFLADTFALQRAVESVHWQQSGQLLCQSITLTHINIVVTLSPVAPLDLLTDYEKLKSITVLLSHSAWPTSLRAPVGPQRQTNTDIPALSVDWLLPHVLVSN